MKSLRGFILLSVATTCHAASLTGSGTISFFCYGSPFTGSPLSGPVTEVLSSSLPAASLTPVCSLPQPAQQRPARLDYSASYGSLSIGASSYWFAGDGATIDGQVRFSDNITVEGPASGFLVVSGEAGVGAGTDAPPSSLDFGLSLDGQGIVGGHHTARHGVLDDGTVSSIRTDFSYFFPFTADIPLTISAFMDVHTGGIYLQGISGNLNVRLSVVDDNRAPVDYSLQSESGFLYNAPEPNSVILATSALLAGLGSSSSTKYRRTGRRLPERRGQDPGDAGSDDQLFGKLIAG